MCFALPAGCDLEVGGRKLVGSAQTRHAGVLLQQNSLPLRLSHALKQKLFGAAAGEETLVATDLASALGREPSFAEVRDAIVAGFADELNVEFRAEPIAGEVLTTAQALRTRAVIPSVNEGSPISCAPR